MFIHGPALRAAPLLALWLSATAQAQERPNREAGVPPMAASSAVIVIPKFRSALDRYPRYADQAVMPWRDTNDAVEKAGGWQAYAREAAQADEPGQAASASAAAAIPSPPASAPVPAASPAAPASAPHAGHMGHRP